MIISERQVLQLMDYAHAHLCRLAQEHGPIACIEALAKLLYEIACQQSNEPKEIK